MQLFVVCSDLSLVLLLHLASGLVYLLIGTPHLSSKYMIILLSWTFSFRSFIFYLCMLILKNSKIIELMLSLFY